MVVPIKREWLDIDYFGNDKKNQHSMNRMNRDLLVLFNQELLSPQAMEHEVELLHELLHTVENLDNLVVAHEIVDINKYRIINDAFLLHNTIDKQILKPFVFLNCKN